MWRLFGKSEGVTKSPMLSTYSICSAVVVMLGNPPPSSLRHVSQAKPSPRCSPSARKHSVKSMRVPQPNLRKPRPRARPIWRRMICLPSPRRSQFSSAMRFRPYCPGTTCARKTCPALLRMRGRGRGRQASNDGPQITDAVDKLRFRKAPGNLCIGDASAPVPKSPATTYCVSMRPEESLTGGEWKTFSGDNTNPQESVEIRVSRARVSAHGGLQLQVHGGPSSPAHLAPPPSFA